MSLGQSIRGGVKWLMFGKVGHRLTEFAFGIILARLLVPADFGMIATVAVFTGFVGMLASGGMGQALVRAKHADEHDFTAVFTLQLALGILVYAGFFFAAPYIARFFEHPLYTDLIRVSALSFLLRPFLAMRGSWLNREMNFKSRTVVEVSTGFITGLSSSLMAWAGMGVWSLTLSGLLGAMIKSFWLGRLTPLKLRINPDTARMRAHGTYGFMITANDFLTYIRNESRNLILSKMAGPAFLGLYSKGESMSRLPNQFFMSPTVEPVFRAMSKAQDDLDKTNYLFYKMITLLMAYTTPFYVWLWWVAEPFIGVVYGEKWLAAAGPMSILTVAGVFLNVIYPCGVVLAAQNKLRRESVALFINLLVTIGACVIGLNWGLQGVAWGMVLSNILLATHFYILVYGTLQTRVSDLFRAATPGIALSMLLFSLLAITHIVLGDLKKDAPFLYLLAMTLVGAPSYAAAFLFIPNRALESEAAKWRQVVGGAMNSILKARS